MQLPFHISCMCLFNMSNIAKTPEDFGINYIKTIIHHIIIIITNIIDSICFVNLEIL